MPRGKKQHKSSGRRAKDESKRHSIASQLPKRRDVSDEERPVFRPPPELWTGSLGQKSSNWRASLLTTPGWSDALFAIFATSALAMLFFLPVAVLIEVLFWVVRANYRWFTFWMNPAVLGGSLFFFLLLGLGAAYAVCCSKIIAFSFDRSARLLTYTESRFARRAASATVPFDSIAWIRACLPKTADTTGYFEVCVDDGKEDVWALQLGSHIPIESMRQHLNWLRQEIPERIQPTLQLDT